MNTGNFIVQKPIKVPLPELDENDEIQSIYCGWKNTCLLTNNKKLIISDNHVKPNGNENDVADDSKNDK